MKKLIAFLKEEDGATAIEYGLLAALISVVMIATATTVGVNLRDVFDSIAGSLAATL